MMKLTRIWCICVVFILAFLGGSFITLAGRLHSFVRVSESPRYSYYLCTQIFNESEHYLYDWLDHQFNAVGFKNVCIINIGAPLSKALRQRFSFAYVEKKERMQEYGYCLSSCFIDRPMRPSDLLLIHDIDEYLNVRKSNVISQHYDQYDMFHFSEIRYGFVMNLDSQMMNRSLRTTNRWRKPHHSLGEYEKADLKEFFKCKAYAGWPACDEGNGKEMIRVGAIKSLEVHFHTSHIQPERRYYVDMSQIRLNHYVMRTKQDAMESALKWQKLPSRLGQIALNHWFRLIYDDSIVDSKRL